MTETKTSTFRLERPDGASLNVNVWLPDGAPKATIEISHGMAEYGARYAHVAKAFVDAGYAVYAHDQRGHGESTPALDGAVHLADADGWILAVDDLKAIHDHIAEAHPGLPHFLFGHSMGSFMVQTFLFRHPGVIDGVILQGSDSGNFAIYSLLRAVSSVEVGLRGKHALSSIPKLQTALFNAPFKPKRTVFDWIAADDAVVDAYIANPLCGNPPTTQFFADTGYGMKLNASAQNTAKIPKNVPMLIANGENDVVGDRGKGIGRLLKQYSRAGLTNVEHKSYPGLRHEIHNEASKAEVLADHIAWLDRQVNVVAEGKSAA